LEPGRNRIKQRLLVQYSVHYEVHPKESDETVTIPNFRHPAYHVWADMKQRCFYPNHDRFEQYGGRGISVCAEWARSFAAFWRDMGAAWFHGAELDRIDGTGHYNRQSCQWLSCTDHARKSDQDQRKKNLQEKRMKHPATFAGSAEAYVTAEELGNVLHLSAETVIVWSRKFQDFPHLILPSGFLRFRPSEVEMWLRNFHREEK
jgi:hypothetical protein